MKVLRTIVFVLTVAAFVFSAAACGGGSSPASDQPTLSPEAQTAYRDWAAFMVRHFKGRVRYYEIWNEPEAPHYWPAGVKVDAVRQQDPRNKPHRARDVGDAGQEV